MKYYAGFEAGSSYNGKPFVYTNKKEAIKDIREIAEGQVNGKQNSHWWVKDEDGYVVAAGRTIDGKRYRTEL